MIASRNLCLTFEVVHELERYVARTTGHVQQFAVRQRLQLLDEPLLPATVNAGTHHIVHKVVFGGHVREDAVHCGW